MNLNLLQKMAFELLFWDLSDQMSQKGFGRYCARCCTNGEEYRVLSQGAYNEHAISMRAM